MIPARIAGEAAARAITQARLVVLPTGHNPFVEASEAFLAEVDPFLDGLRWESQQSSARCPAEA